MLFHSLAIATAILSLVAFIVGMIEVRACCRFPAAFPRRPLPPKLLKISGCADSHFLDDDLRSLSVRAHLVGPDVATALR